MVVPEILGVSLDKVVAEFIGTFVLVFTVGLNVLTPSAGCFGITSIALSLVVMIYALGGVSGGHFNPAVSFACLCAGKTEPKQALLYMLSQFVAGVAAAFCYVELNDGKSFNLAPGRHFGVDQAVAVEVAYTCMLCFVVLSTACTRANDGNGFFGLAIGFVIVAGGYGAGAVSGGAFNPAVALGVDVSSAKDYGVFYSAWYIPAELAGAGLAVGLFRLVYPEEFSDQEERSLLSKCVGELVGTYFLVLTVLLNVKVRAVAAAWSIAASLMSMIYAVGASSGAHLNPAVTLAVLASRRNKIGGKDAAAYVASQIVGGLLAATTHAAIFSFGLGKAAQMSVSSRRTTQTHDAFIVELVFTFVLCFVVLAAATTEKNLKHMFGLAIGMCVTAGGVASSKISGGSLNPAVSLSGDFASLICGNEYAHPENLPLFVSAELLGGLLASGAFFALYPAEFKGEGLLGGAVTA